MTASSTTPTAAEASKPGKPGSGPIGFDPAAGVLAAIFPGLGHFFLGQRDRAAAIACGILGLFLGGILIGGVDCIDRREDRIWFIGQALVGPLTFGVDWYHQNRLKVREGAVLRTAAPHEIRNPKTAAPITVRDPATGQPRNFLDPRTNTMRLAGNADRPPNSKSLGRMNELGTLMVTLAGMTNFIVVLDALFPALSRRKGLGPAREGATR